MRFLKLVRVIVIAHPTRRVMYVIGRRSRVVSNVVVHISCRVVGNVRRVFVLRLQYTRYRRGVLAATRFLFLGQGLRFRGIVSSNSKRYLVYGFRVFMGFVFFRVRGYVSGLASFVIVSIGMATARTHGHYHLFLRSSLWLRSFLFVRFLSSSSLVFSFDSSGGREGSFSASTVN